MKKIIIVISLICFITPSIMIMAIDKINLSGYIIFIDAGHGGKDNGASYDNVLEDSINLSISKLIVNNLIDRGAIVFTSRDDDYDLASNYDKNRKAKDLKKRVELINNSKPHLFISVHLNTFPNENVHGGQVFSQNNEESKSLALNIQDQFNKLSNTNKKIKTGDYYILNKTKSIGVLVECGFLTNYADRKNLVKREYQIKITEGIVEGIYNYLIDKS